MAFYNADCPRIVIENPVPMRCFGLPAYSQIIEPYYFGDPWKKRTCLWIKGVPPLFATMLVEPQGLWVGSTSKRRDPTIKQRYVLNSNRDPKRRARTFPGIARAMAEQWAGGSMRRNHMSIEREFRRFANRRKPGKQRTKCKRCGAKLIEKPGYGIICPECGYAAKPKEEQ